MFIKQKKTYEPKEGNEEAACVVKDKKEIVLDIAKRILESIKAGKGADLEEGEIETVIRDYWEMGETERNDIAGPVMRNIYEGMYILYSTAIKYPGQVRYDLDRLYTFRRLFDDHNVIRGKIACSEAPVFNRFRLKDGYIIYADGVEILNPEDADKSRFAYAVAYAFGEDFEMCEGFEERHRFVYLSDKVLTKEDIEYANSLCIQRWPEFKIIIENNFVEDSSDKGGPEEIARWRKSTVVNYIAVSEHGKCMLGVNRDISDYSLYAGAKIRPTDSHYAIEEEPPEGTMIFRI